MAATTQASTASQLIEEKSISISFGYLDRRLPISHPLKHTSLTGVAEEKLRKP
jgi:hypothetical protein